MTTIESQWDSYSRLEQLLAAALYNGTEGYQKRPPFRELGVRGRQPFLDQARDRMNRYMKAGRS